jgi:hypothetical protein
VTSIKVVTVEEKAKDASRTQSLRQWKAQPIK